MVFAERPRRTDQKRNLSLVPPPDTIDTPINPDQALPQTGVIVEFPVSHGIRANDDHTAIDKVGLKPEGLTFKGRHHTAKVKAAISKAVQARWDNDPNYRAEASKGLAQVVPDPAPLLQEVQRHREMGLTINHTSHISQGITRKWQDPEYRAKMREAHRRKWQDPKFRQQMVEAHTGKTFSPAHKASIGKGRKRAWNVAKLLPEATNPAPEIELWSYAVENDLLHPLAEHGILTRDELQGIQSYITNALGGKKVNPPKSFDRFSKWIALHG